MGVSGPRSLLVGLPLVVTCHILAQEGTLGGNTAICQETPLDILPLFVLRGARLFVTVSGPFVAKTVNKLNRASACDVFMCFRDCFSFLKYIN